MYKTDFRAVSFPYRLYSGKNALDKLPAEVGAAEGASAPSSSAAAPCRARRRSSRACASCSATSCAGVFDEIDKDTSRSSTMRAAEAARAAQADLVIGVGAGSVIQGTRIVAILLAEKRPVEELITQYPEHGPGDQPQAAGAASSRSSTC